MQVVQAREEVVEHKLVVLIKRVVGQLVHLINGRVQVSEVQRAIHVEIHDVLHG